MENNTSTNAGQASATPPSPSPESSQNSSSVQHAWLAYLLGWISGLFFFLTASDATTKFHGAQSIILFGGVHVFQIVAWRLFGSFGMMLSSLVSLGALVLWIVLMVKTYRGEKFLLPVIGEFAESWARK